MIFTPTALPGAVIVDLERREDERGFFARSWCAREFADASLPSTFVQCNVSWNPTKHTMRGMHWQAPPRAESKLVRCTRGALFDVIVDLRRGSPTYLEHIAIELDQDNRRMLLIPGGMAHGFLTLADGTEVFYQMTEFYSPEASRGARWDDPAFGITWPFVPAVISERDRTFPEYAP